MQAHTPVHVQEASCLIDDRKQTAGCSVSKKAVRARRVAGLEGLRASSGLQVRREWSRKSS